MANLEFFYCLRVATALLAASSKVEAAIYSILLSFKIFSPFSILVPANRITRGNSILIFCKACTIPSATQSHLLIPANIALDCKIVLIIMHFFIRNTISELRDKSQEDPKEIYALDRGLNYVSLDGNIGNIINGAGLAMASMDMIKLAGGEPANFLDVGGGATPEKIVKAFKLITSDEKVKVILINIFAGINRCDWVAEGIVQALQKIKIELPLVIRLAGTNIEKGEKILKESKIEYIAASTLEDAANKAVATLKQ